jgi:hypothetical protein
MAKRSKPDQAGPSALAKLASNLKAIAGAVTRKRGTTKRRKLTGAKLKKAREKLALFWAFNDRCVAAGFPDLSPWWKQTITDAYEAGVRNIVIRGGRRGGKSTTMCRIACFEASEGGHVVPAGDTGFFALISADRDQAKARLQTCTKILSALDVRHSATAEQIIITQPVRDDQMARGDTGIKVFTASLTGVVSFTGIGALCDEQARWRDKDSGSNPAEQVVSSLSPAMATQPDAMTWHVSSPWSTLDIHHKAVERGDGPSQVVFVAPTWVMNPTISEEETHRLEPDEISWQREYKAEPMSADETKFFPADHIAIAEGISAKYVHADRTASGGDFAFRRDASACVTVELHGSRVRLIHDREIRRQPPPAPPLVPSATIRELANEAERLGSDSICCDLHYIETVREHVDDFDLELVEFPTSPDAIAKAYVRARVLLTTGKLDLTKASPALVAQLQNTTSKPTDGAGLSIKNPRLQGSHGDLVSAMIAAVWSIERSSGLTKDSVIEDRRFGRNAKPSTPGWSEYAPKD